MKNEIKETVIYVNKNVINLLNNFYPQREKNVLKMNCGYEILTIIKLDDLSPLFRLLKNRMKS